MSAGRIEPVDHGGDLDAARRRYPEAPEPWIDLSTGINPHAYRFVAPGAQAWERLPQTSEELALLQAATRRYGAESTDQIAAAPGSQALIQVLPRLMEPSDVAVLAPTYTEHAAAWARCGHRVAEVETLADAGQARVVVVVNPNNPTGRLIARAELCDLAVRLQQQGGLLVVDEAFVDFTPQASLVQRIPAAAVVLRSFGKTYGLAGVRLGFALASAGVAQRLRNELGPWSVSGPALGIGTAALLDDLWLSDMGERLARERGRLDSLLAASGFAVLGGTHLFRLAEHARAGDVADVLGRDGIYVRRFASRPTWLRFGLPGTEPAWERLGLALHEATALAAKR
ncbi:MAG: threonine-phosphate decarboxylase CobD [Hyphomicrobium sp.]|jgi:cobalamin biosynthetic protein CobC